MALCRKTLRTESVGTQSPKLQPAVICMPQLQLVCSAAVIPKFTTLYGVMNEDSGQPSIELHDLVYYLGLEPVHHGRKIFQTCVHPAVSSPDQAGSRVFEYTCFLLLSRNLHLYSILGRLKYELPNILIVMCLSQVFPELRAWCEERKVHLVDCDLRWVC